MFRKGLTSQAGPPDRPPQTRTTDRSSAADDARRGTMTTCSVCSTSTPTCPPRRSTAVAGVEVGVWEMSPGTATDVEVDEVFVVLSGAATVTFDDGEAVDLGPGSVVRLRAGEHTTWVVRETLRKIYVA
jgi:mannose-6-phosphate isomerase-like protein (cupin superfamily)